MSKSANKTLIGAFVVGALALLVLAIAVFGSGKLFQSSSRYVLFFEGSISGLSVGSPVMFRGVPVGRVTEIRLTGDLGKMVFQTPVFIELTKNKSAETFIDDEVDDDNAQEYLDRLVAHGLRATLATQSLLTGQLMIEMDFYPKTQLPYIIDKAKDYDGVPEIPTIPSKLDNIWQQFTSLPFSKITKNVLDITDSLKSVLDTANADQMIDHREAVDPDSEAPAWTRRWKASATLPIPTPNWRGTPTASSPTRWRRPCRSSEASTPWPGRPNRPSPRPGAWSTRTAPRSSN